MSFLIKDDEVFIELFLRRSFIYQAFSAPQERQIGGHFSRKNTFKSICIFDFTEKICEMNQ